MKPKIVPLSQIGSTPDAIRNYIISAYNTWPIKPEYILLVGSGNYLPSYNNRYDDFYGNISGDYRQELSVGRFSCNTPRQCSTMVIKSISYEKNPFSSGDSGYILKGTTVVREDSPPDPYYQADARYIRNLVLQNGFIHTDSFLSTAGHNRTHVVNAINEGRSFVVYRGQGVSNWWSPFDCNPNLVTNWNKLPIIVSATCQTMTFAPNESMVCEGWFRKGRPDSLAGALGVFGCTNTGSRISLYRGVVTKALFDAFFSMGINCLGDALKRAKFFLDSLYHNQTRYQEWNLLGDPELPLYTKKPQRLDVVYDSIIQLAPQVFRVEVRNLTERESALVCFQMDSTVYKYGYCHSSQAIEFNINPTHIGWFSVTVSSPNRLPYEGQGRVIVGNRPYPIYQSSRIRDRGNYDGKVNPGENVGLFITLKNIGGLSANNVWGVLTSSDPFITIFDSVRSFGNIPPGESASADEYFFTTSPSCTARHNLNFLLRVYFDGDSTHSPFSLPVYAGRLACPQGSIIDSFPFGNGNGRIGSGEACKIRIKVINKGNASLANCLARLRTGEEYLQLTDSVANFGIIPDGESLFNLTDELTLIASPSLPPGRDLQFKIILSGSGGTYQFRDSTSFIFRSEGSATNLPQGPDAYGYFAYDNTDTTSGQAPVYNWLSLIPPGPGRLIPEISTHDAAVVTLPLPFRFRYYGLNYDSCSICCNGFLALGRTDYRFGNNYPIPDTAGPSAMVSPFWDDLSTNESSGGYGDIYEYYDTTNHRWIVEFNSVAHHQRPSVRETFQVIFYDPQYYPTPTGDGEIIFQYAVVSDVLSNTVGIKDHTELRGLQYLYNNSYSPNSAPLTLGRAIKFSTKRPRDFNKPFITLNRLFLNDSLGNGNGLPEPGERIKLITYLGNEGDTSAFSVEGILKSLDEGIIIDSLSRFGDIPVGGQANNASEPFLFEIPLVLNDSLLHFYIKVSADNEYTSLIPFEIPVSYPSGITDRRPEILAIEFFLPTLQSERFYLRYKIPYSSRLKISLFDILGREVSRLFIGKRNSGLYTISKNLHLPSGIYFLRFELNGMEYQKRFLWLR